MDAAARPSVGYYLMLALSAALATLGLICDSAAVIIGAMIIAPLMNPIVACSYAIARRNLGMLQESLFSIITGIIVVLAVSSSITFIVDYRMLGDEAMARSNPNLIDLGIAVASGTAGAFAWTRKRIANAIPGVAVAVALVPPLCVAGMGLIVGDNGFLDPTNRDPESETRFIERGAFLLFLTNFAAIVLCSCLVFLIQGYGRWIPATLGMAVMLAVLGLVAGPLGFTFNELQMRSRVVDTLVEMSPDFPGWKDIDLSRIRTMKTGDSYKVELHLGAPTGVVTVRDAEAIKEAISDRIEEVVDVTLRIYEYEVISSELSSDGEGSIEID